jgi:putative phage-type endonuclease
MIDPKIRRQGFGGSDAAPVMGLSPYRSLWAVVMEKKGLLEPPLPTPVMQWGQLLETPILQSYAEQTRRELILDHQTIKHPQYPLVATYDATVAGERRGVDAKYAAGYGDEWEHGPPLYYQLQAVVYMAVSDFPCWDFAVSIRGAAPAAFTVYRDAQVESKVVRRLTNCWNRFVVGDEIVPIDGSLLAAHWLQQKHPKERRALREATGAEVAILEDYETLRICQDDFIEQRRELENRLKETIGDAEGLRWAAGKFTWKKTKDRSITDWKSMAIALRQKFIEDQKERDRLEEFYTRPETGARRIYFTSAAYKASRQARPAEPEGEENHATTTADQ